MQALTSLSCFRRAAELPDDETTRPARSAWQQAWVSIRLLACFMPLLQPAFAAAGELVLDGVVDEAFWRDAQVFDDFRVTSPYTLVAPAHPTVARLAALPEGLAVSFVCEQPPGTPRVRPRAGRDADSNADRVNFAVDFDGDGRLAYNFMVTLGNAISDEVISNENHYNGDWDGVWQHALHDDGERWSVEMLIPWSVAAMREDDADERAIAVYFDRVIASLNERSATPVASYARPRFVSEFMPVTVPRHRAGGILQSCPTPRCSMTWRAMAAMAAPGWICIGSRRAASSSMRH